MYLQGGLSARRWRLKTVPLVAFNQEQQNLMEGGKDVSSGDAQSSPPSGPRRRDEHPRGGADIRTAP